MKVTKLALGLGFLLATIWAFAVPDAAGFQHPESARIFFFHFPNSILCTLLIFTSAWFSLKYLATEDQTWDARALASGELGFIYAVNSMLTGIVFSKVQWGAWWQGDPRQVSFLIALLFFGSYFVLRSSISDESKRARSAASYAIATILPEMFLIFIFPRLPQVQSFHPSNTIVGGLLDKDYGLVTMTMLVLFSVLSIFLYKLRVRSIILERKVNSGDLETTNHGAPTHRVVRHLSVHPED